MVTEDKDKELRKMNEKLLPEYTEKEKSFVDIETSKVDKELSSELDVLLQKEQFAKKNDKK